MISLTHVFKIFGCSNKSIKIEKLMAKINGDVGSLKRAFSENKVPIIGTHDGTFHCDEALACFMLKILPEYENAEIIRSRSDAMLKEKCCIIVDVGGEYDHERKLYDHHQKSFQSTFSSLRPDISNEFHIRLSSAGLIYVHYGERIIETILRKQANKKLSKEQMNLCFKRIYQNFICELDAIDNGIPMFDTDSNPRYSIHTHVSARVGELNPSWDKPATNDGEIYELFCSAMNLVGKEFISKVLNIGGSWINAREVVKKALLEAKKIHESGQILFLEPFCPWKAHLYELENENNLVGVPKLVIFQDVLGSWRVAGVPINPESFIGRKFLPECWRGLRNDDLNKAVGIDDCLFVHHSGFIGGANNKKAAIAMAIKAVEWE